MRTQAELQTILDRLIEGWENECVEFKEANDNYSTGEIGKYFSALANEANLKGNDQAWLVFGVNNRTRAVVGTDYRVEPERLHGLKQQIGNGTEPSTSFREIHVLAATLGRVVLFEIPPAPRGIPIGYHTLYYARNGESLVGLSIAKQDEIRQQAQAEDWSAVVCPRATIADLLPEAITRAREIFIGKFSDRIPAETIQSWSDATFLDKAKLTIEGGITRACLLLLGRPESTHHLSPSVAEISWKLEGPERAYEHFGPPFLLATTAVFQRIRHIRLTLLPPGQMIPIELSKYDQRIVLEALHNCVAHQDYSKQERILVIERQSELEFQSAGNFFDGTPNDYIRTERTPMRYRNRLLAEAMVNLRMIDRMGFGIREIMWKGQRNRYFPLPDYVLSDPNHVVLRIQGRFIDENYSRALLTHADMPWPQVLTLDAVQKGMPADDITIQSLRKQGLIEGRKPNFHVTAEIATATETQAEYIRHRAFDDRYFCDMILEYVVKFGSGQRADFERLLEGKFSDLLTEEQKRHKIRNLLQRLRREGKLLATGKTRSTTWVLPASLANTYNET